MTINSQQAEAAPQVVADSDFQAKVDGPVANAQLGKFVTDLGDVNGDDVTDYAVNSNQPSGSLGAWVLFGPLDEQTVDLADLAPEDGYLIHSSNSALRASNVGDQNGDGTDDLMVQSGPTTVMYSVADPATDLPECDGVAGAPVTRCLDFSDPRNLNGDRLGFELTSASNIAANSWAAGDLDGDDDDEIVLPVNPGGIRVLDNGLGSNCDASPGLCTIDIDTLSVPDVVTLEGPAGVPIGVIVDVPGDTNGDGKDDIVASVSTDGSVQPGLAVIYGKAWDSSPVAVGATGASVDGYKIDVAFAVQQTAPMSVGDVNGDGLPDVGLMNLSIVPAPINSYTVVYGREGTPDTPLNADPPAPGTGVKYRWDAELGLNGNVPVVASLGDLNGDRGAEFVIGSERAKVDSLSNAGVAVIVNSKVGSEQNEVALGPDSPGSDALILGGSATNQFFGSSLVNAGDIDGDGVNDIGIGALRYSGAGLNFAGRFGLMSSSRFFPGAGTGHATPTGTNSAYLNGVANANRRDSNAYFEYGTTAEYGQSTADQTVGHSPSGRGFDADVTGLTADTEYHYRAVIQNDLGIKAYGTDRTFTTSKTPVPLPTPCEADPTAPGCKDFCKTHPTAPGCFEPPPPVARLSGLVASSHPAKVKRGKKGVVKTWITSTGGKEASGVKVCAKVPKRLAKVVGKRCRKIGSLAPGKTAKAKFKVKVKAKARKRARVKVKLIASAEGLKNRTAKVRFTVR